MNTSEHSQESSQSSTCSFAPVAMYFSYSISIIISRPLSLSLASLSMSDCRMTNANLYFHSRVALPLISVEDFNILANDCSDDFQASLSIRMMPHKVMNLSTVTPFDRKDWRAICFIVSVSPSLVGPSARWIRRVAMWIAFFPQRSGTTHQLPELGHSSESLGACVPDVVGFAAEAYASRRDRSQVRETIGPLVHLWQYRAGSSLFSTEVAGFFQRPCQSTLSSIGHRLCSDKRSSNQCAGRCAFQHRRSEGISNLLGEGVFPATGRILLHPAVRLLGSQSFCEFTLTAQSKET